jgi:hypothetical protein
VSGTENSNEHHEFASASNPYPFYWFVRWVHRLTAAGDLVAHHWGLLCCRCPALADAASCVRFQRGDQATAVAAGKRSTQPLKLWHVFGVVLGFQKSQRALSHFDLSAAFQAYDEGSIPFTRSNVFNGLDEPEQS